MCNALRYTAIAANILFFIGILAMYADNRPYHPVEYGLYLLAFAFPALNLLALCTGPDREERQLRRQVNKAELRRRLKELDQP